MDLSEAVVKERVIKIKHPATNEETGVEVTLMAMDDDRMKQAKRRIADRRIYLEQRNKAFSAEELEENQFNLLFAAMLSWTWNGDATWKGKKPELNRAIAKEVCDALPWFEAQLTSALNDAKGFF